MATSPSSTRCSRGRHELAAAFQRTMRARFVAVVEEEIGRKVAAFVSTSHQGPDINAELFVLEPADDGPPGGIDSM